jgi:hypothetical protein
MAVRDRPSNVVNLAEERSRRCRRASNSISIAMFEIGAYNMIAWAAYWRLMMGGSPHAK